MAAVRLGLLVALVGASGPAATPASGQSPRWVVGAGGGWSGYGDLTPGIDPETVLEPGRLLLGQAEAWIGRGHIGLRLEGTYASTFHAYGPGLDYTAVTADLALLLRPWLLGPDPWIRPHLALGGGVNHYVANGHTFPVGQGALGPNPVTRLGLLAGAGLDIAPGRRVGLRLEVADRIVLPSVGPSLATAEIWNPPSTHNLRGVAVLQIRFGSTGRELPSGPVSASPARSREPAGPAESAQPVESAAAVQWLSVAVADFLEPRTASLWAARALDEGLPARVELLRVGNRDVARLRLGAVEGEARAAALEGLVREAFGWRTMVVPVPSDTPLDPGVARQTARFLTGRASP